MTNPQDEIDRILDNFKDGILGSGLTGYDIDSIESKQEATAAIEKLILEARVDELNKAVEYHDSNQVKVKNCQVLNTVIKKRAAKLKAKLGDK